MYQAYVGIATRTALRTLQVEGAEVLATLRQAAAIAEPTLPFWAVLPESEAQRVTSLLRQGHRHAALRLLDGCARELGRISRSRPRD